jgi:hypothetical protein
MTESCRACPVLDVVKGTMQFSFRNVMTYTSTQLAKECLKRKKQPWQKFGLPRG